MRFREAVLGLFRKHLFIVLSFFNIGNLYAQSTNNSCEELRESLNSIKIIDHNDYLEKISQRDLQIILAGENHIDELSRAQFINDLISIHRKDSKVDCLLLELPNNFQTNINNVING